MKPKVAFVVQRYGPDVNGGAEQECRWTGELMRDVWDITVLTTCAQDYMTWANHYPEGDCTVNGVKVKRFSVDQPRDIDYFNELSSKVLISPHTSEDEIEWIKAQGPDSPGLISFIEENIDNFDIFIFFTYLYGTTFWGLSVEDIGNKSILVPTAHDELPIYLCIYRDLFRKPSGFIFNSHEEKDFLIKLFEIDCSHSDIIGVSVQVDETDLPSSEFIRKLPKNYVVYVGRIDESKGCRVLFNYWIDYKERNESNLHLVLTGRSQMHIPEREDIIPLGFISEEEKYYTLSKAQCLLMPSPFESLSIVLLESWLCNTPVLVNGKCVVLKGQCRRSNGGLWYENYNEFEACLKYILANRNIAEQLALNGKRYTKNNYNPDLIKDKYISLLKKIMKRLSSML